MGHGPLWIHRQEEKASFCSSVQWHVCCNLILLSIRRPRPWAEFPGTGTSPFLRGVSAYLEDQRIVLQWHTHSHTHLRDSEMPSGYPCHPWEPWPLTHSFTKGVIICMGVPTPILRGLYAIMKMVIDLGLLDTRQGHKFWMSWCGMRI